MTAKNKFILMLITVFCGFVILQVTLFLTHKTVTRTTKSLMNQYDRLKKTDVIAARRTLEIIIKQDPHHQKALRELGFWYLQQGDIKSSIEYFKIAYQNNPRDKIVVQQLSRLYMIVGQQKEAEVILMKFKAPSVADVNVIVQSKKNVAVNSSTPITQPANTSALIKSESITPLSLSAEKIFIPISSSNKEKPVSSSVSKPQPLPSSAIVAINKRDQMMNEYYQLKKENSDKAWEKIVDITNQYPDDVQALKEAGYYALLTSKNNKAAAYYFCRVYELTCDPKIAMQLGYIYDNLKDRRVAYHYFDLATYTSDTTDRMTAELAKSNLRGVQTKILPYPYYATLDYSPLYMSRFKLLIQPIIFRVGMTVNEKYDWKIYFSYRRTSDDKSNTANQISNIFEDNAAISAIGTQLMPFPKIPQFIIFSELGKSVDLVYRNRSRRRSDFRGGGAYYNEWGKPVEYTLKPTWMLKPYAELYADAIYYNRYHDGIATFRARPGFRIFRFGSLSLDIYYRVFIAEDQAREFYNNFIELGPGLAFQFSDRYPIVLRYERIHGRYLPASSPSPNPYPTNYHNMVTQLNAYFEF